MDKENVIHMCDEILLSHRKEWSDAICSNMEDLETVILSEVRQRQISYVLYMEHPLLPNEINELL